MFLYLVEVVIVTLTVSYLVSIWRRNRRNAKLLESILQPSGLFLLGNILDFADPTKILQQFLKYVQQYGGVLKTSYLWILTVVISDQKHVEEVLGTTKILHKSREYDYFHRWLGTGLLTSPPEKWKKTRRIITPTFHFQILEQYLDVFDSCSSVLVEKLRKEIGKTSCDVYKYVTLCTLDVICESAMGTKVNAQVDSESQYVTCVKEMSRIIRERFFNPVKMIPFLYYMSQDYRKEKAALKVLHAYTNVVIQRRRKEITDNMDHTQNADGPKKKTRLAFLDLLLQSSLDGRPMTDYEIRQEVDTFMFEGHDTTASALSSSLLCLALNQDVQDKVVHELKEIFFDDRFRPATYEDLQNMRYLEMVIKEVLRLYPPVPLFGRRAVKDVAFGDGVLPENISVMVFAWGLHRDPTVFPNPEKFDPERFTLDNQGKRGPFSYVPFSAGPRNCIGQRFAMLEMKSTISKVLRYFEVHPVPGFEPLLVPDIVMKSLNGVKISLRERL